MKNRFFAVAMLMLLSFAACTRGTSTSTNQNDLNSDEQGATNGIKKYEGTCTVTDVYTDSLVLVTMNLAVDGDSASLPGVSAATDKEAVAVGDVFTCWMALDLHPSGSISAWSAQGEGLSNIGGDFISKFERSCFYKSINGVCNLNAESSGEKNRSFDFVWTKSGTTITVPDNVLHDFATDYGPKMENDNSFKCTVSLKTSGAATCESCLFEYPATNRVEGMTFACSSAAEQLLRAKMQ